MSRRAAIDRVRHWLVEPLIVGYALAGVLAINLLQQEEGRALLDAAALNTLGYRVALVISFWRAVLAPYLAYWMPRDESPPDAD